MTELQAQAFQNSSAGILAPGCADGKVMAAVVQAEKAKPCLQQIVICQVEFPVLTKDRLIPAASACPRNKQCLKTSLINKKLFARRP